MSYSLAAIAVDLKEISAAIGSRNQQLVDFANAEFGPKVAGFEELFDNFVDDLDGELTVHVALIQMIMGGKYNDDQAFVYGYALEALCRHFGETLPNDEWSGIGWQWTEAADDALALVGIDSLSVSDLTHRELPFALPKIKDFPAIGFMELAEIRTALADFDKEKLLQVKKTSERRATAIAWMAEVMCQKQP